MTPEQKKAFDYVLKFGSARPATLKNKTIEGIHYGSEIDRRFRELRKKGILISDKPGKYAVYYLAKDQMNGYQKYKLIKDSLSGHVSKSDYKEYSDLSEQSLEEKLKIAEDWINKNKTHPKIKEAERRLEVLKKMKDEYFFKNAEQAFL